MTMRSRRKFQGGVRRASSLVHLELNGLSQLNATFGRKAGDDLLREVERALRLKTRRYRDMVWRVGGATSLRVVLPAARDTVVTSTPARETGQTAGALRWQAS